MFVRQLIADASGSIAEAEEQASLLDDAQLVQLYQLHHGYGQWKVIFPGEVLLDAKLIEIFGLPARSDSLPLEGLVDLYHPEDRGKLLGLIAQTLQQRKGFHCALRIVRPDGETRIIETIADLRIRDGKVTEMFGASRDATADFERDALLLGRTKLMQDVVAQMPAPVVLLDERMRVLDCNAFWLKSNRLADRQDAIGRSLYVLFPDTNPTIRGEYERALKGEAVRSTRNLLNVAKSSSMVCSCVILPWFTADDRVGGLLICTGWSEFGFTSPAPAKPVEKVADFDGSLLDMLKEVG